MRLLLIAATVCVAGYLIWSPQRPVDPGPGVLAPEEPRQSDPDRDQPFVRGEFSLQPLARFEATARVLAREDYRLGTEADLSPTDLALGWGRMSDTSVVSALDIDQSGRWYHYRWAGRTPPIPLVEIVRSSANMHFIPADEAAADALERVREGQVVSFSGYLVEARRNDGWRWRSSLTRNDSGGGACEVVWLERLDVRGGDG
jgi:hypothetical protein